MKTGSAVSAMATPPATWTTPTSTPCWGPTRTWSSFAPSRRRMTCSKSSGGHLPRLLLGALVAHPGRSSQEGVHQRPQLADRLDRVLGGRDGTDHGDARRPRRQHLTCVPDVDPSDPDQRKRRRGRDVAEPVQPDGDGFRLGLGGPDGHAEIIRARHLRHPDVLRVPHAHPEYALGPEASSSGRGIVVLADVRAGGAGAHRDLDAIVHEEWDARLGARLRR